MFLTSTETLPEQFKIVDMYSMVQITQPVEISDKGLIRKYLEKDKNEYQEAINTLANSAPPDANAIIGIQVSSSTQQYSNGTFLYLTYIGTPVRFETKEEGETI